MAGVRELLVRYLIDDELRTAFERDPAAVLADFELADDERAALLARDERVLALIGRSLGPNADPGAPGVEATSDPAAGDPAASDPGTALELAPIGVWLSVLPHATAADGVTRVQWQVSLHTEAPDEAEVARARGVVFKIDLEPCATRYGGREHVVFRSTIGAAQTRGADAPVSPAWEHDLERPETVAAIATVRAAEPDRRLEALIALAETLRLRS